MTRPGMPTTIDFAASILIKRSLDEQQTVSTSFVDRPTVVYKGDTSSDKLDPPRGRIHFITWHGQLIGRSSVGQLTR
jgi:hypothetical protein